MLVSPLRLLLLLGLALPQTMSRADLPAFAQFDHKARAGAHLNVVFFGASLTWGANATDPQLTSYRAVMAQRFEAAYPHAHFRFCDAAIGGTGSQLGVFRLDRDVLRHRPDLVFLDFSANDDIYSADEETLSSYEALVRRIILDGHAPVVQVIFPCAPYPGAGAGARPRHPAYPGEGYVYEEITLCPGTAVLPCSCAAGAGYADREPGHTYSARSG